MNVLSLVLLAIDTIGQIASNPALGLGKDVGRVAALLGVVAKFGRAGESAVPELQAFVKEIEDLAAGGQGPDPNAWDALTARRHADYAALLALKRE
jgi:hypothetical protein